MRACKGAGRTVPQGLRTCNEAVGAAREMKWCGADMPRVRANGAEQGAASGRRSECTATVHAWRTHAREADLPYFLPLSFLHFSSVDHVEVASTNFPATRGDPVEGLVGQGQGRALAIR